MPNLVDQFGQPLRPVDPEIREDAWANAATGLGVWGVDKNKAASFLPVWRVLDQELTSLMNGSDIARKIVGKPPEEMFRRGFEIEADNVNEDEKDSVREYATEYLDIENNFREGKRWGRLYGGCLLLLGIDDGRMPWEPLDEDNIRSLESLSLVDRRYSYVQSQYAAMGMSSKYGKAQIYLISNAVAGYGWDAYGASKIEPRTADDLVRSGAQVVLVHESRVIRFDGNPADVVTRQNLAGWSWSVLQVVYEAMRQFEGAFDSTAALLADASQGVFKLQGLMKAIAAGQRGAVAQRLQWLDYTRSVIKAIALDAGTKDGLPTEDFTRIQTPLGGIAEILDKMMLRMAAAADMPATEIWGRAPAGLNATGESDTRKWYDRLESEQKNELGPQIKRVFKLLALSKKGPLKGRKVNWKVKFHPLWAPTDKEMADTRLANAQRDVAYIDAGVITPAEVAVDLAEVYPRLNIEAREKTLEGLSFDPYENQPPPGTSTGIAAKTEGEPLGKSAPVALYGTTGTQITKGNQPAVAALEQSEAAARGAQSPATGGKEKANGKGTKEQQLDIPKGQQGKVPGSPVTLGAGKERIDPKGQKSPNPLGAPQTTEAAAEKQTDRDKAGGETEKKKNGKRQDYDDDEARDETGQWTAGGASASGSHESTPARRTLSERATAWLSGASSHVQSFFTDHPARTQTMHKAAAALKAAPGQVARKTIEEVKKNVAEAKTAFGGIKAALHGRKLSAEQKTAIGHVALKVAIAVSAHVIAAAVPLEFVGSAVGEKVLEHVADHVAHHAMEALLHHATGIKLDALADAQADPEQWLAEKVEAAVAEALRGFSDSDADALLEELAGSERSDARPSADPSDNVYLHDISLALVWNAAGELLCVSRPEPPYGMWLPGGHVKVTETPAHAAMRELREEVGVLGLQFVRHGVLDNQTPEGSPIHVFTAQKWEGVPRPVEVETRFAWMTPEALIAQAGPFEGPAKELAERGMFRHPLAPGGSNPHEPKSGSWHPHETARGEEHRELVVQKEELRDDGESDEDKRVRLVIDSLCATRADGPATRAVFQLLLDDYPASSLGWVLSVFWYGPNEIPTADIDSSNRDKWRASHDGKIGSFMEKISEGTRKPAVLVKVPDNPKYIIVDGHHRYLGHEKLGKPLLAYTAEMPVNIGPWSALHDMQKKNRSGPSMSGGAPSMAAEHGEEGGDVGNAAIAIIFNDEGKVLAAKGAGDGWRSRAWILPGGTIEKGELRVEAMRREIAEETGLNVLEAEPIKSAMSPTDGHDVHVFRVKTWNGKPKPDGHEVAEVAWLTPAELEAKSGKYAKGVAELRKAGALTAPEPKEDKKDFPEDFGSEVPEGGSSCESCRFRLPGGLMCRNKDFVKWQSQHGGEVEEDGGEKVILIPAPSKDASRYCCNEWKAAPGAMTADARMGATADPAKASTEAHAASAKAEETGTHDHHTMAQRLHAFAAHAHRAHAEKLKAANDDSKALEHDKLAVAHDGHATRHQAVAVGILGAPEHASRATATTDAGDWDESKHPRAPDGKFGEGGGESKGKVQKTARELIKQAFLPKEKGGGGFTYRPGEAAPKTGYIVSLPPSAGFNRVVEIKSFGQKKLSARDVKEHFVKAAAEQLQKALPHLAKEPTHFFGGYLERDKKNQAVALHFDVNEHHHDQQKAEAAGRARNQISIYDIAKGEEILTGGTGRGDGAKESVDAPSG